MQGLRVVNRDGQAPTAEEIDAAHRVANTHKENVFGTILVTDKVNDIEVEYHPYKNLAITQGNNSIYFGYGASVEMRCRCRGVVLEETAASANQRSAVFLTDGTELGSYPITQFELGDPHIKGRRGFFDTNYWYGGNSAFVSENFAYDDFNNLGIRKIGSINFIPRDDSCNVYVPPKSFNSIVTNISTGKQIAFYPFNFVGARFTKYKSYTFAWTSVTQQVLSAAEVDEVKAFIDSFIIPSQQIALTRENKRRLKCSQAQHELLRNVFLPPEFEYFIKTTAPKSVKVRRKYPMLVLNRTQTLLSDIQDANTNHTRIWSASVTVKYDVVDEQDNVTPKQETFVGTVQEVDTAHIDEAQIIALRTTQYTYTNLPMLVNNNSGKAYPLPSPLPDLPFQTLPKLKTIGAIWHNDKTYPLLVIANGTLNVNYAWVEDDMFGGTNYNPVLANSNIADLVPVPQKTSDNVTFAHPQFLYDYIKSSPPIEFTKDIDGNKVAVTPSEDWLASRIADGEEFKVVPLNLVQGIKIVDVVNLNSDALQYIELEVRGQVVERIQGTKSIDPEGNIVYSRYNDRQGSGRWGELKTTGQTKTETVISSKEYQNVLRNIREGVFDVDPTDYPTMDAATDAVVTGNKGMFPLRTKDSGNQPEIDHAIVYGYSVVKYDESKATFTAKKWVEFTEDGKIDIFPDDDVTLNDTLDPTEITVTSKNEDGRTITKTHKLAPRYTTWSSQWNNENCVCVGNKLLWTDVKQQAKTQKDTMKNDPLSSLETLLYRAVSEIIKG